MKTEQLFIGIDVSKATLDICVLSEKQEVFKIANTPKEIKAFFSGYKKNINVCMENTGRYNLPLYQSLAGTANITLFVVSPLHLKKSLGLIRGKDDKTDATRIAKFIEKNHTELTPWQASEKGIEKLKVLITERRQRVKMRKSFISWCKDYSLIKELGLNKELLTMNKKMVMALTKQIEQIEKAIKLLVSQDELLNHNAKLIQSVPGVGPILAWVLLAKTNGFKQLNTPRQLACYAGVVPFPFQSGTSIRGKMRTSHLADKALKTILHMGALRAVRLDNDLKTYYERKVAEGKNKMSALNAVRNKMIHRICAVIKNQKMYERNLTLS